MSTQAILGRCVGMVTNMLLVRLMDVASFGVLTIISTAAANIYGLARLGIDGAIHVETAGTDVLGHAQGRGEILGTGFAALAFTGTIAAGGAYLGAPWLAQKIYGSPELSHWLRLAALIVFAQCLAQFAYVAIVGLHRFADYAKAATLGAVLSAGLTIGGAYHGGLRGAAIASVAGAYVLAACIASVLYRSLRGSGTLPYLRVRRARFAGMLTLGLPPYISGLITIPAIAFLQGYVTKAAGTNGMAYLRIASVFGGLVGFIPHSIAAVTLSHLSSIRSSAAGPTTFGYASAERLKVVWSFALVIATAIQATVPIALPMLFGSQYGLAIGPATLAIGSGVLLAASSVCTQIAYAARHPKLVLAQAAIMIAVMMGVGLYLIPRDGLLGYLKAEAAGNVAATLFLLWRAKRNWLSSSQSGPLSTLALLTSATVVVPWLYTYAQPSSQTQVTIGTIICALVCLLVYRLVLTNEERIILFARVRHLRI